LQLVLNHTVVVSACATQK